MLRGTASAPSGLWLIVFGTSGLVHASLLWLHPWSRIAPPQSDEPVPIQIVEAPVATSVPNGVNSAPPRMPPAADSPRPEPSLQPQVEPPPENLEPQPRQAPSVGPAPRPQVEPPPPPPASPEPAVQPPASVAAGPSQPAGGQLIPLEIQRNPQGRDLPDRLPSLRQGSFSIQPLLANCGWNQAPNVVSTLTLGITVEASGEISQAEVLQGTQQPEVDRLISCLVKSGLRLEPATSAGAPQPTDAAILRIQAQF